MLKNSRRKKVKFKAEKSEYVEWFDSDKVQPTLTVRFRQAGDRFIPLGLTEEKKVGKFLTGAKVSQQTRQKTLVIADNEKIIWVWPVRISEQAKVTAGTRKILQLKIVDSR
jgi:tRNA(Ile)-lysidine synthase